MPAKSFNGKTPGWRLYPVKRLIQFSLLMLFIVTSKASAQWTTQSPLPTQLEIFGVGAPSNQHVFITTSDNSLDDGGSLFESTDGGSTWVQRNIPVSLGDALYGIFFFDSQNGWTWGNDNYRTTDGGTTWTQLPFLGSTYFMKFYTAAFGLASGNFGQYISRDGGLSWEPSPNDISSFDFFDNQNGLGVTNTGIYKTTDGGLTFSLKQSGDAISVSYLSSSTAVGILNNQFFRSTDGGETWNAAANAEGRIDLLPVSENVILAYGRSGTFPDFDDRVFRSSDGGLTWTDLGEVFAQGSFAAALTFAVPDPQTIVASNGEGNMFRSADAGLTWTQTFNSPAGLQQSFFSSAEPSFADAQTGYFGYGPGFIIKTTNAGASWFQISSGLGNTLNDIDRLPNGSMIAVGENGTILFNQTGSSIWTVQQEVTQNNLKAVQVLNQNDIVMVDDSAKVYKSSDGGLNWTAAASAPSSLIAEDIYFNNLQEGWVIGSGFNDGALFHTTDGGVTWIPVPDFLGAYIALEIVGQNIWAANVTGLFYKSTDNGNTWTPGNLPNSMSIQDLDFFDANIGYAVGGSGEAFRSDNGGFTWEILPTPNIDDQFTDLYMIGPNEFWISTNSNKAYYSANGGQGWAVLDIGSSGFGNFSAITANTAGDAWTVGYQGFIEHFAGPPPPPQNQPPTASFTFQANGLTVNFADASFDPDGTITSWSWDFGDGIFSADQNPTHTYDTADTYIVSLKVTDDDGDSDSTIRIIAVQQNPGGVYGNFTEVTPLDSIFVTPQDEDFWVISTAPADFDSDGDLDIAVLGYYVIYNQSVEDRLLLLVNSGADSLNQWNFSYITVPLGDLTTGASDIAWGDADKDGDLDLALATDGAAVIYRNDAGTLILTESILPGYWEENSQAEFDLRSVTWADYDNDGDNDLLIPSTFDDSTFSYKTSLMRNDSTSASGNMFFTEIDTLFAPTSHASSTWADFDNDQDLDLLLVNIAPLTDDGFIRRYRNDGNGIFTGEDILGTLKIEHGEVQWGDYDSDGDLDILVAGNINESGSFSHALRIYRNDSETYVPVDIPAGSDWFDLTAATWADYDSDGDMDILLAGNYNSGSEIEGRARIYVNDGTSFFPDTSGDLPAPRASGDRGGTFSWFDIDGEGDLDYFIAGQYFVPGGNGLVEAQMHLYRNDPPGQNAPPTSPTNLNAAVQNDNSVILTWTAAIDDHTPAAALTYDLNLFRDGTQIVIPQRLPEPGNVSSVTEWLLNELPDGSYDWILRAVDASYSSSAVISGEFNIGVVSVNEKSDLPTVYDLKQNYPNPFNPATTINYSIPKEGLVVLKIYNAIGQEIASLVNEVKPAGNYNIAFNAKSLSSGIYFYRIEAGSFVQTRKMILLK